MGFHFSAGIFQFRRNSPLRIHLPFIFSPFSTLSAVNPFYPKSFSRIFQECSKRKANEPGRQAHARMIVSGFKSTVIDANCLLQMYIKCSRLECASKVFDRMPERNCVSWNTMMFGYSVNGKMGLAQSLFDFMPEKNVVSWNSLISGFMQNGNCLKSVGVFVMMGRDAVAYDEASLSLVLKACAGLEDNVLGLQIHGAVVKLGFGFNLVTVNALMSMYANCKMFNESLQVYVGMLRSGMEPDEFTYSTILKACASGKALQHGREIHGRVIKCGMGSNLTVSNIMIDMYCKCGMLAEAEKLHERMKEQTLVSWTAMISGYSSNGQSEKAQMYFSKMLELGTEPNDVTYLAVLGTCSNLGDVELGKQIHAQIIKQSMQLNVRITNTLVDMYCKCGVFEEAGKLHERMKEQSLVSWTAMISGYSSTEGSVAAHKCFSRMLERGIRPNEFTFATVLSTCTDIVDAELGKQIHGQIIKQSMQSNVYIINTLVDMYSKCGNIQDSILMFRKSRNRDVVTWTSMVCAYAQHGSGNEALQAFEEMLLEKVTPDQTTFTGVLRACADIGLVDKALHYFQMMKSEFGLEPLIEQYSCMVDALGRSGRIKDALKLIEVMHLKATDVIWRSLLSNCKMQGDVKVAEIAARNLLQLDPRDSSTYVLLSQTYFNAGMWDEASKMRRRMRSRGLKKKPGLSMILDSSV